MGFILLKFFAHHHMNIIQGSVNFLGLIMILQNVKQRIITSGIYISSSIERLFCFNCLKCEGVKPVTFLNCVDR